LGIIGVHPSLLPKLRGASPIQSAILTGEQMTGTSLFKMDAGIDSGPILAQREIEVDGKYYAQLLEELANVSAELLIKTLPDFYKGLIEPREQDDTEATFTKLFEMEDARVVEADLEKAQRGDETKALQIERMIRALNPEPGTFSVIEGKRTKLLRAHIEEGRLVLEEIQREGKKPELLT